MGDEADRSIDEGVGELAVHERGECEGECQYCALEEEQRRTMEREERKRVRIRRDSSSGLRFPVGRSKKQWEDG